MPDSPSKPTLFLTTRWTLVRDAGRGGDTAASAAMGDLCAIYWKPLYRYARRRGNSREDAEDLVQGFLARIAEPRRLGNVDAETGLTLDPADDRSPDKLYDREWALTLLGKVLADLEATCRAEGNEAQSFVLKSCLTADSARIPYAVIAGQLATTEGAARVAVHRLRKRYRHLLTEEIGRTLCSPDTVEEEMHSLFAALGG